MPQVLEPDVRLQPFEENATIATPIPNYGDFGNLEDWTDITQEMLDNLPQRWSRSLIYLLVAFGTIVIPWAFMAEVDEVGTAKGRFEPKGKTVRLDATIGGKVASVKVKEGQQVTIGQPLIEFDTDLMRNELIQAQAKLEGQISRKTQLQLAQRQLSLSLNTQRLQFQAQLAEQQSERNRTEQRISLHGTSETLTRNLLEKDNQRSARFREYSKMGILPRIQAEDAERVTIETQQRLEQNQADRRQAQLELTKQDSTAEKIRQDGELALIAIRRQVEESQAEVLQAGAEISSLRSQIKSIELKLQQSQIKVPISGTLFELPVQNPGAVLQPGQMVATIAPKGVPLVLRAQMTSRDSGFLKVGLPVKVKLDAFPYQDYGILAGKIRWIAPDSKRSKMANNSEESVFDVEVELAQNYVQVGDRKVTLNPGQTASAEVIIRRRHVGDYMLDPFRRLKKGGVNF
jgi:hemolysin D